MTVVASSVAAVEGNRRLSSRQCSRLASECLHLLDDVGSGEYSAAVICVCGAMPLAELEKIVRKAVSAAVPRIAIKIQGTSSGFQAVDAFLAKARSSVSWILQNMGLPGKAFSCLQVPRDIRLLSIRSDVKIAAEYALPVPQSGPVSVLYDVRPLADPLVKIFDSCIVFRDTCELDGKRYPIHRGAWAFFVPELEMKILNASNGCLHCTRPTAPDRAALFAGNAAVQGKRYTVQDWLDAYSKSALRRAAENCVAASRLAAAGLGPKVLGCVVIRNFVFDVEGQSGPSAGICIENLDRYAAKRATKPVEMCAAGVQPDRIRSCLRQQFKGYVSDLNSVVGVMPIAGENQVSRIEALLNCALNGWSATI